MNKIKKIISVLLASLMCLAIPLSVSANEENMKQENRKQVERTSYIIFDADGSVQSQGDMPLDESESTIQTRDSWGARTINSNGYMYLYRQADGFPFFLSAGSRLYMEFGLNRNAYITSAVVKESGQFLAHANGLTGGRHHSVIVQQTGEYHGYIYNTDSFPVTVTYANFTTAY